MSNNGIPIIRLSKNNNLVFIGDIHLGNKNCDEKKLDKHLAKFKKEQMHCILMGDPVESTTPSSSVMLKGAMDEQAQSKYPTITSQYDAILKKFSGIPIDATLRGNHENRILNHSDFDVNYWMARQLNAHDLREGGYLCYLVGKMKYVVYINHGEGSLANPTSVFRQYMMRNPDANIYAAGHTHDIMAYPISIDTLQGLRTLWWLKTGTYLITADYQERRPSCPRRVTGCIVVTFSPSEYAITTQFLTI